MLKHKSGYLAFLLGLLLAVPAFADGGISALGGLLDAMLLFIGAVGLPIVALMIWAVASRSRKGKSDTKIVIALVIVTAYVLCALFFYFVAQDTQYSKFPGLVAAVLLALFCVFFIRGQKWTLTIALTTISVVSVALLVTPAKFWKGNAIDVVEVIFVDNSDELEFLLRTNTDERNWQPMRLADGRMILQFERGESETVGDYYIGDTADIVSLREFESGRSGQWFEVTHYMVSGQYRQAQYYSRRPPRHSLFQRTVNMYRTNGQESIGVLLNEEAEIDFSGILLQVLSWSGKRTLKNELVSIGNIDVNGQDFIDEAFDSRYVETYRFLVSVGIKVDATDSDGRTLLHRVAYAGDVPLMRDLVKRGASLAALDGEGATPVQVFRQTHVNNSRKIQEFENAFPSPGQPAIQR